MHFIATEMCLSFQTSKQHEILPDTWLKIWFFYAYFSCLTGFQFACYLFVPLEETVEANSSNLKALTIYLQYLFTPPVDILRTTYLYLSHGVIKIDGLEGTRPVQNLSTTGFDY